MIDVAFFSDFRVVTQVAPRNLKIREKKKISPKIQSKNQRAKRAGDFLRVFRQNTKQNSAREARRGFLGVFGVQSSINIGK